MMSTQAPTGACHHWVAAVCVCEYVYAFSEVNERQKAWFKGRNCTGHESMVLLKQPNHTSLTTVFPFFSKAMKRNTTAGKDNK